MSHVAPTGQRSQRKKVLAVASGGGHWVQLLRLREAFADHDVVFVTTHAMYAQDVPGDRMHVVPDATRWDRWRVLRLALSIVRVVAREKPDVVISTGAAPGCLAVIFARLRGARTVWIDSIANVHRLSMSGRLVRRFADLWLTQWPHLETEDGPEYAGKVF